MERIKYSNKIGFLMCVFVFALAVYIILATSQTKHLKYRDSEDNYKAENELVEFILSGGVHRGNLSSSVNTISQDNPVIVRYVRNKLLIPPNTLPYKIKLRNTVVDPSEGQSQAVLELLKHKRNGFFIECGGNDGERLSNTLYLERSYNWTGILFEADPKNFERMVLTNRKVWMSPACLSNTPNPQQISFYRNTNNLLVSGLNKRPYFGATEEIKVSCLPLYTFLVAMNVTDIDYLSLDVEGNELEILKTIPFDLVNIKVLTVEHAHFPGKIGALKPFLESKGYTYIKTITTPLTDDSIYIHSSLHS